MKIMEPIDLQEIRKSLEENRKILFKRIKNGDQESISYETFNVGRSDLAWRYDRRQRKQLLLARAKEQLSEVEEAIHRLENCTYGKCLGCGQPINPERLRVLPSASLCIRCQQQQE